VFGILPAEYEQELNKKYKNIEENLKLIQSTNLNQEQRIMLQKFIETSFKESLQITGEQRQLDHLALIQNNNSNNFSNSANNQMSSA
jgi:acetyl-CoA carboxylase alpha subunit